MYPHSNDFQTPVSQPNFPARLDHGVTGAYPLPLRRGLNPTSNPMANPTYSGFLGPRSLPGQMPLSMMPQTPQWNGFGSQPGGPVGLGGGRPGPGGGLLGNLFGFGPQQSGFGAKPGLNPEAIKTFLTTGMGRLNTIMTGIDKVSKTVQQLSPLVQMFQGFASVNSTARTANADDTFDLPTATTPTSTRKRTTGRRSRSTAKRRKTSR
jgi:hypothetical protein